MSCEVFVSCFQTMLLLTYCCDKYDIIVNEIMRFLQIHIISIYQMMMLKVPICGLQLPREPHRATRLLKLTGRW